ncbi:thiamine-binding protein [Phycicoccus jejuensis]|uniref:thiamine-binding protein n=1 Tax=Phycicoccus jejuensis TaxID=367299 RepID=UPI0004C30992|nr:thiamine-binding protein [Phycicoccus jejuensis]
MIVAFSIAPARPDDTGSYAEAVAEAVGIVRASGLPHETNAMFTNLEGEWDEVFGVLKQCTEAMTARHPRVSLVVKADIRPGHTGMLTSKVQRIDEVLGEG